MPKLELFADKEAVQCTKTRFSVSCNMKSPRLQNIMSYFQVANELFVIEHDLNLNISHPEDGFVQHYKFRTQSLTGRRTIYVSIAAVNKVCVKANHLYPAETCVCHNVTKL